MSVNRELLRPSGPGASTRPRFAWIWVVILVLAGALLIASWVRWMPSGELPAFEVSREVDSATAGTTGSPASAQPAGEKSPSRASEPVRHRVRQALAQLEQTRHARGLVLDTELLPLSGVELTLHRRLMRDLVEGVLLEPVARATSAADGTFLLAASDVAGERLVLSLEHETHARLVKQDVVLGSSPADLGRLVLEPGFQARGRVTDRDRQPVAGAEVLVICEDLSGREPPWTLTGWSGPDGWFTISHVPQDVVSVDVVAPGFAKRRVASVSLPRRPETDLLHFWLLPATSLSGSVQDWRGTPLAGVEVHVTRSAPVITCEDRRETDGSGRFHFDQLEEGYYRLEARHPRFATASLPRVHTETAGIELTLELLGSAEVAIPALADLQEVRVEALLRQPATPSRVIGPPRDLVCRRGHVIWVGLEPGLHELEVRVPGATPARTAAFSAGPGEHVDLGELHLETGHRILGRIEGRDGAPVVARISLPATYLASLASRSGADAFLDQRETWTDASGAFSFEAVEDGSQVLIVRSPGYVRRTAEVEVTGSDVDLGAIALEEAAGLHGSVATRDGRALSGAHVEARRGGRTSTVTTGAAGEYRFEDLAPGPYELRVFVPDREDEGALARALVRSPAATATIHVAAGQVLRRDFEVTAR